MPKALGLGHCHKLLEFKCTLSYSYTPELKASKVEFFKNVNNETALGSEQTYV